MTAEKAALMRRLFRWLPSFVLLAGIPLAALALVRLEWATLPALPWSIVALAAVIHLTAVFLLMRLWRFILLRGAGVRISDAEAILHIGMTLAGKYVPGKVWGLFSRGVLLSGKSSSVADTVVVSLAEQGVLMHAACVTAALAYALSHWMEGGTLWWLALTVLLVILSALLVARWLPRIADVTARFVPRWPRMALLQSSVWGAVSGPRYPGLLAGFTLYWSLLAAVLLALASPLLPEGDVTRAIVQMMLAVPVAVVAGFLALWMPSGIGVREGVLVLLLNGVFTWQEAVGLSLLFRCWCVAMDICLGVLALLLKRSLPQRSPLDPHS